MPRYIRDFRLQAHPDQSFAAIHQYLTSKGFQYINFEGENVFKKGTGWLVAPQIIKVTYGPDRVRVEGWIKYAALPGVYVGELGFKGYVGCLGKGPVKKAFRYVEQLLGGDYTALCAGRDTEPGQMPPLYTPLSQLNGGR